MPVLNAFNLLSKLHCDPPKSAVQFSFKNEENGNRQGIINSLQTVLLTPKDCLPVPAENYILTGTASSNDTGLTVIPQTVTVDNLKILEVTVKAPFPLLELDEETPVATLTPMGPTTDNTLDSMPLVQRSQSTLLERPILTCAVFFPNTNHSIRVKGLLDTATDVTIFAEKDRPRELDTTQPCIDIKGVGGASTVPSINAEGPSRRFHWTVPP
ncbi:hypothetical protein WISP_24357 [Willisornis vidua]|uniref:Peptidase A2 domain-containing protein n=1 Tax=Willisornis vidua TaxID=1566151 RepID=A0ABQ9DRM6_9PASS|nr:hypothetical protein WISP_24357 [Willisornis vidua]